MIEGALGPFSLHFLEEKEAGPPRPVGRFGEQCGRKAIGLKGFCMEPVLADT